MSQRWRSVENTVSGFERIGAARIFNWRGTNHKSHAMTPSEVFVRGTFVGQRYRRMDDQKHWPCLALHHDFAMGRGLKPT